MSRPHTSPLWEYFNKYDIIDKKAKCRVCGDIYSYKGSTGNLKAHLKKMHYDAYTEVMTEQLKRASTTGQEQQPLLICTTHLATDSPGASSSADSTSKPASRQQTVKRDSTSRRMTKEMRKKIDDDLLDLFIDSYQPFSLVDDRAFKKFARWIPGYELPTRKTISTVMLPALYNQTKNELKTTLSSCNYSVCLTIDLWTANERELNESYIAVTAHYMTSDFELKTALLDCRNFQDSDTSEDIQELLTNVIAEWGLTGKINFIVSDSNNNVQEAIRIIGWEQFGCYAHTLNSIVEYALAVPELQKILEKVKKIVRHYKKSTTALESILKAQIEDQPDCMPKRFLQEVPTRWKSTYHMVQRFVDLEKYIKVTMTDQKSDLPAVTNIEWNLLTEVSKILQPFDQATETISNEKYMPGSLVIVMTRCLMTTCDKFESEPFHEVTKEMISRLQTGLTTEFGLVEKSRTFSTCTFLDPRYKLSVFSDEDEATKTKNYVQEMLINLITQEIGEDQSSSSVSSSTNADGFRAILNKIVGQKMNTASPLSKALKEINTYINDDPQPIFNGDELSCPLEWWRGHKCTYPYLSKLVQSYGNVMASCVPCERIFTKIGITLNDRRTRLPSQKVGQLTFLNVNLDQNRFS
ncbi:E3 SUMO-protein ligase ZBED1-like [Galleria mellonella]|uniref:E3 SUMO-protein ligase ZBED1-like n=1 Tax=Galleria mellonella TaxID=7137 RepID=A0ABM3MT59_GALME|nr:E3 SUMO-protein ligase ZBED1-like [Galleria mellonella]